MDAGVHWIDLVLIVLYLGGITLFGFFFGKRIKSSTDYSIF